MPDVDGTLRLLLLPLTMLVTSLAGLLKALGLLPLWAWYVGNSWTLFSVSAIFGWSVLPEIGGVPSTVVSVVVGIAIITGITAGLWRLRGPIKNLLKRY